MILTAQCSKITAKLLREAIHEKTGRRYLVTARVSDTEKHRTKLILRYGNSSIPRVGSFDTDYNSAQDVRFLASKESVAIHLLTKGFNAPKFMTGDIIPDKEDYPVFIRTSLNLFKGRGMTLIKNEEQFKRTWKSSYYWCSYIPTSSEFRVHIVRSPNTGKVSILRGAMKVLREEFESGGEEDYPIRTNVRYKFSRRFEMEKQFPKMSNEILKAAKTLPGYFFSLDVGWSSRLGRAIFFETNTASGMDNGTVDQFSDWLIKEKLV